MARRRRNEMDTNNDNTLLEMLRDPARRDEGFTALMRGCGRRLYWHLRRIVVDHDDAEDALQETAIKIYDRIGQFKGEGDLMAWVYSIATREALQQLRRRTTLFQSIDSLGDELAERLPAPADGVDNAELLLQRALLTLPTTQRIAFNMRYYDEMTYDQIAAVTGKSVASLKTSYHYAVEKIKDYLKANAS